MIHNIFIPIGPMGMEYLPIIYHKKSTIHAGRSTTQPWIHYWGVHFAGDACPQETVAKKQTPPAQQARGSPQPEPSRRRHGPAVNLTKSLLRLRTLVRWCGFQV